MEITYIDIKPLLEKWIGSSTNIQLVEKYIRHYARNPDEERDYCYQVVGLLLKGYSLPQVLQKIHCGKMSQWDEPIYNELKMREDEQISFYENPFEVEEGVIECNRCGSKRTIIFQMQTRSADEPTSTFAQCVACKHRWKDN